MEIFCIVYKTLKAHNKAFKSDSKRLPVSLRSSMANACHTLTQRYATQVNLGVNLFGFLRPFVLCCRQISISTPKFLDHSNRKTGKILCLPQSVLALARCQFCGRKVWKGQANREFRVR